MKIKNITFKEKTYNIGIGELFEQQSELFGQETDFKGNEVIDLTNKGIKVLNHNSKDEVVYDDMNYLIRHKIQKDIYKIKDQFGNYVCITADHSLIVERDNTIISVKCTETKEGDLLISNVNGNIQKGTIYSIEKIEYNNPYVYDISVSPFKDNGEYNDITQSFFGNNILVHNSNYCTFQEVREKTGFKGTAIELINIIYENGLEDYLKEAFKEYNSKFNGMGNYLNFELETISNVGIWIAKKKYMHLKAWEDGNTLEKESLKATGVEIIQASTPPFARKYLKDLVLWIMGKADRFQRHYSDFIKYLRQIKKEFEMSRIEDISMSSSVNNYSKFVIQDNSELKLGKGIPIHLRAAAIHNHLAYSNKLTTKYELLKSGDKVKWYYTKSEGVANVFAYRGGAYPKEFALEVDYNLQFERSILSLVNRIMESLNLPLIDSNLIYTNMLF